MTPLPVPRSTMRKGRDRPPRVLIQASAVSTRVSVSGRGTNVEASIWNFQAPELLLAEDARDGFAREAAARQRGDGALLLAIEHALRRGRERRMIEAERVSDKNAGIELGRFDLLRAEGRRPAAPRAVGPVSTAPLGEGAGADAATPSGFITPPRRRAAPPGVRRPSASMISPSASPSITCGNL